MLISRHLVKIGKALASPVRLKILTMLCDGELCGCELVPNLQLDPSVVSRHMATLERAGLVVSRREGVRLLWSLVDSDVVRILEELSNVTRDREVVG